MSARGLAREVLGYIRDLDAQDVAGREATARAAKRILPTRLDEQTIEALDRLAAMSGHNRSHVLRVALRIGIAVIATDLRLGRRGRPPGPEVVRRRLEDLAP